MSKEQNQSDEESGPVENAWAVKIPEFTKGDMKNPLAEESSFSVLFPKYREKYLQQCWPILEKTLKEYGVIPELDLLEGRMIVKTTRKTWDPYIILKARDIIKLLARSVPIEQAVRVLRDDTTHEMVKIKTMVRNKERFIKRRQRLIGANGTTLKALELLTDCYILIQGGTAAAVGPHKGVQQVVRVIQDTMKNIHPVNLLKALMIKRQLAQDETLKNTDWSRFIPNFKAKNVQTKKPKNIKKKKPYTPFPPPQLLRKIDIQMSEGKIPIGKEKKSKDGKKNWKSEDKRKEVSEKQKKKRAVLYEAPDETSTSKDSSKSSHSDVDVEKLKKKIKTKK